MIVDASALVAILRGEDDARELALAMEDADKLAISAVTLFEAALRLDGEGETVARSLDRLVQRSGMEVVPFEAEHATVARDARTRFGRGTGHPARLNFGDCMAYATAYIADEPLLFKGDDFRHTDVRSAI